MPDTPTTAATCQTPSKRRFGHKPAADAEARRMKRAGNGALVAYRCRDHWHVGHPGMGPR